MNFELLRNSFYTVNNIFGERQSAVGRSWYERTAPRPSDALLLFTSSTAIYRSKNQSPLYVPHGALVYIPRGYIYSIETHSPPGSEKIEIMLFEFNLVKTEYVRRDENKISLEPQSGELLTLGSGEIEIIDFNPRLYEHYFAAFIDAFEDKNAPLIVVYRAALAILECLLNSRSSSASKSSGKGIIDSALEQLSGGAPERSIAEIAASCFMSVSGFEKQFRRLTGMTPTEYRLECKLARVKQLLCERRELSLEEVAQLCCFDDAAYLCRVFKRRCGVTPRGFAAGATAAPLK